MYNPDAYGFRNVVNTTKSVGSTPVLLTGLTSWQNRSAIQISALTQDVYLKFVPQGSAAPTISATDYNLYPIYAGDGSPFLGMSQSIDVYGWSASTGNVNIVEAGY